MRSFKIYGIWPQADIHTHIHTYTQLPQCSHASVGLAQARPNYVHLQTEEIQSFPTLRADKNTVGVYADMMHTGSSRIFSLLTLCIRNIDNIKNMV